MDSKQTAPAEASTATSRGWLAFVRREIRSRPLPYISVTVLAVLGPIAARMIFPEAPLTLVVFGGVVLGAFFGFCATADKLFE